MVTSSNDIIAKFYGLWLWVEHGGSLLFINLVPKVERRELHSLTKRIVKEDPETR